MVEREREAQGPTLRGCSILVVEDDYVIALDLAASLQDEGAVVVGPVGSVSEAYQCLRDHPRIDAAVLDVRLAQDELVFPLADVLRAKAIPFVFTTGCEVHELPERYRDTPALEKPVSTLRIAIEMMRTLPAACVGV